MGMMVDSLTCITGKREKAEQIQRYLGIPVDIVDMDLMEIQELDTEIVTKHKAIEAYNHVQRPVIVDDNGMIITSMGQLPGTFIKFFLSELGPQGICKLVAVWPDRSARVFVSIGFSNGNITKVVTGEIKGTIATEPRGTKGFGWDSIFIPDGYTKTRAEMEMEDYDATSPRREALEQFLTFLKQQES